ncbi:MAG: TM0106 family RecB-like putative nuclease [Chloroflexi bacterium]|nr:TM0106 family RecB-like putative nuclease [Chloroflexota bacterium]
MSRFTITAQTLRDLLTCERRVWLDVHGDPTLRDETSPETLWLYAMGNQHEQRVQEATAAEIRPVAISSWDEGVTATRDLMRQEVPGIIGAFLEYSIPLDLTDRIYILHARVDRLVRLAYQGKIVYAPVEIKQRSKPEEADWVQLDFYVWLLDLIQGTPPPAWLWLGANALGQPRTRLEHEYDESRLLDTLKRVMSVLDAVSAPPIHLEDHCKHCLWYSFCQTAARQEGHLDLLYNIPHATRDNLRFAGVNTLADVLAAPVESLTAIKGIKKKTAQKIRANAQALLNGQPVWQNTLPDDCRQPGWMFDLETCEVNGKTVPWCMGWCDIEGNTHIALVGLVQLPERLTLADGQRVILVPDSDTAWDTFAEAMSSSDRPVYHWSGYDAALLRGSAPGYVVNQLIPRMHDLNATLKQVVSLPLKSTSIKVVSTHLGFEWPGQRDYRAAYVDYRYWLDSGDLTTLARACTYQRADVQSLAFVWRWLVTHPPESQP